MSDDPVLALLAAALQGRYVVQERISAGHVYVAEDLRLGRRVAIKVFSDADPAARQWFLARARDASRLSQPNLIQIVQVEEAGALAFMIMAFVAGDTVAERLRRGRMSPDEVARLLHQVALAVAHAHGRGVTHGGLHAENVLIEASTGRAIVTDFALSRALLLLGPASAQNSAQTMAADIRAIGVLGESMIRASAMPARLAGALSRCASPDAAVAFPSADSLAESLVARVDTSLRMPAAIRNWVNPGRVVDPVFLYALGSVVPMYLIAVAADPGTSLLRIETGLSIAIPLVASGVHRLMAVRRLMAEGFTIADLRQGMAAYVERKTDELGLTRAGSPRRLARILRGTALVALATTAIAAVATTVFMQTSLRRTIFLHEGVGRSLPLWGNLIYNLPLMVPPLAIFSVVTGLAAELSDPRLDRRLTLLFPRLRLAFWRSRLGGAVTRVLSWRLTRRSAPGMLRDHPTEVALGIAAGELFDALPAGAKREVGDVPAIVRRLEDDARALRTKVNDLDKALAMSSRNAWAPADAPADPGLAPAAEVSRQAESRAATLSRLREDARGQLKSIVGALERIRLDLIRLGAGAGSLAQLTGNIRTATDVLRAHETFTAALTEALGQPSNP